MCLDIISHARFDIRFWSENLCLLTYVLRKIAKSIGLIIAMRKSTVTDAKKPSNQLPFKIELDD